MTISHPQAILLYFSRVILFPRDENYHGSLNSLHRNQSAQDPSYSFLEHFRLNNELLDSLKAIKNVPLYIFTSGYVQEAPVIQASLRAVFKGIYSAERLGVDKSDPSAYEKICQIIEFAPKDVLFIDDQQSNLEAAGKAELRTHHYSDNDELKNFLRREVAP